MSRLSTGIGGLIYRSQYEYEESRYLRFAAPFYRPIIFLLTSLIVLGTLMRYRYESPLVPAAFGLALVGYLVTYAWRRSLSGEIQKRFYNSVIQFVRGQAALVGVTGLVAILAAHGLRDHELWILYVLATLIISEHNRTRAVIITLFEVTAFYIFVSYLGMAYFRNGWPTWSQFFEAYPNIWLHILGVWLVTFVFHYLVKNIHGRDQVQRQQQQWLDVVAEKWMSSENAEEQRRALLDRLEEVTGAKARLWLPQFNDSTLTDNQGVSADAMIRTAVSERAILLNNGSSAEENRHSGLLNHLTIYILPLLTTSAYKHKDNIQQTIRDSQPLPVGTSARIIKPIFRLDEPKQLVGVLDLEYKKEKPSDLTLEGDVDRLQALSNYVRLILISSQKREQLQREKLLAHHLSQFLNSADVTHQIVTDIVNVMGFDFATVSLVDRSEDLIRCVEGKNADWVAPAIHHLQGNDIQSRVIREGRTYRNDGEYQPFLDRRIWRKFKHRNLTRVWVPIMSPALLAHPDSYPAIGTIEAGFYREHQATVPSHLITFLEHYAEHAAVALSNAREHERKRELAAALTALERTSREIHEAAAFFEPYQMIRLIGNAAEELLQADIVMIYLLDDGRLSLPYKTEHAIRGKGDLNLRLDRGILSELYRCKQNYFRGNAREDPKLVNLKKDGRQDRRNRTFTQRQNIKSFAGLPLITNAGDAMGFLCINYRRRHEFYEEKRHIIEMFAKMATVALEETFSHRLARTLAIVGERESLAAELHHTLSQNLYGLKQRVKTALFYADDDDMTATISNLQKIVDITDLSLDAMEELLRNLSEQPHPDGNFVDEVQSYIQSMQRVYTTANIDFEFQIEGIIAQHAQFYLTRIAREALDNALRHSQSTTIVIKYQVDRHGVATLYVEDNGQGFDVAKARRTGRYGLSAMDYFAHRLNAQLEITSLPGTGTRLFIRVNPPRKGIRR